ncbi:MAG: DUF3192 domain-containing protein [Gammaproteobacteria bacterium]|nr:DUF3192 domain-containing protein [Gammaproteobacteria bacterium]NNM12107.1 DUF3192 domain-containing protein [Pseudomonadales bacterium]
MSVQSIKTKFGRAIARACALLCMAAALAGCAASGFLQESIDAYHAQAGRISLGQSEEEVLRILQPTQSRLAANYRKPAEEYLQDGKRRKIYFFRSRSFPDGLVTDDEFTPYVFEDGSLIAIGWTAIGGPKTQAQTRDRDRDYDHYFHGRIYHY